VVRGLQAGAAAHLAAEDTAMTQSDIERAFPGTDRPLLDALFTQAFKERFAASVDEVEFERADEALSLLRRTLALL
jgi:hypothetical protein